MPLKLNSKSREDIEKAVLHWIDLLSREKYIEAFELTFHDPYYQWTPLLLESVINGYGLPEEANEEIYKVTAPGTAIFARNHRVYKDVMFFDRPLNRKKNLPNMKAIGRIDYDLPLNGHWSDLTASFIILQGQDFFALELNDIHVL